MDAVTDQFTKEEKIAVKEGMRLFAVEEVGVEVGDADQDDQGEVAGNLFFISFFFC